MARERLSRSKPRRPRSGRSGYEPTKVYADLGSVSSATMLASDLIPAFQSVLEDLAEANGNDDDLSFCQEIDDHYNAAEAEGEVYYESEVADYDLDELFERLGEYAPPGTYFGGHPGDPADYGFWIYEGLEREWDDLKVSSLDEIPDHYQGFVLLLDRGEGYARAMYEKRGSGLHPIWNME